MAESVKTILNYLLEKAPASHAESWDNVGLLVGDSNEQVRGICSSIEMSRGLLDYAKAKGANLVITHHPILFRCPKRLEFSSREDDAYFVRRLACEGVAHICLHTNFDRASGALHAHILAKLALGKLQPLEHFPAEPSRGYGLYGEFNQPRAAGSLLNEIKQAFAIDHVRFVGRQDREVKRLGFVSGSGMFLYDRARSLGLEMLITGDVKYHDAITALNDGICVVDVGHFGSEKHFPIVIKEWLGAMPAIPFHPFTGIDPFEAL